MICGIKKGSIYIEIVALFLVLIGVCSLVARAEESTAEESMDTELSVEKSDNENVRNPTLRLVNLKSGVIHSGPL